MFILFILYSKKVLLRESGGVPPTARDIPCPGPLLGEELNDKIVSRT